MFAPKLVPLPIPRPTEEADFRGGRATAEGCFAYSVWDEIAKK
jgi:hypothetical protein